MSLLDDVSIVVTPNGYKAGELYAVVPVPTEGAEEVTNGDFATDSDWNKEVGWTISGGTANYSGGSSNRNIRQAIGITNGKTYKIQYQVTAITSGEVACRFGGMSGVDEITATTTGTYVGYITANSSVNGELLFEDNDNNFVGSIDNVSVKEYTAADMDVTRATAATRVDEAGLVNYAEVLGSEEVTNGDFATDANWTKNSGWTISGGSANCDGTQTGNSGLVQQNGIAGVSLDLQIGKQYKMVIDVTVISGAITYIEVASDYQNDDINATGVSTLYFSPTSTNDRITIAANSTFVGSVNSVSVKEVTRDNVPRIDYTGGGCPHILAEPQRTNSVPYSEDFSNADWNKDQTTVVADNIVSPDGTTNADKLVEDNTNNVHRVRDALSSSVINTLSVFAKKGTQDKILLYNGARGMGFNLTSGTTSVVSGVSAPTSSSIEDFGNGWFKCSITFTSATSVQIFMIDDFAVGWVYQGVITNNLYIWGAQLEEGSYATSYIPTSGSTVTRNKDIFTRDGIGSLINSTEGVLFVEMAVLAADTINRYISLSNGTDDNSISFHFRNNSNNQVRVILKSGNSNQFDATYNPSGSTAFAKVAFKYKVNDFSLWVNGTEIATDTSGITFSADTLNRLGFDDGQSGGTFFGKVKQLQVYKTALTDTQLAALTS